ncbi:hypothetical protein TWF281_009792 [Arthrobotrys megalospora]
MPTQSITAFPVEIQSAILSQISDFSDQISASQTCKLWQTIISDYKSCQRQRYSPASDEVEIHRALRSNAPWFRWFSCTFQNGTVKEYRYKYSKDPRRSPLWEWRDISNTKFLDDPLVSPFCRVPQFFNGDREGDDDANIQLAYRAYKQPPMMFSRHPRWETFSELSAPHPDECQNIQISMSLSEPTANNLSDPAVSSGEIYQAYLFLSEKTTVKEFVEFIVQNIQMVMEAWEMDTGVERELIFSSIRDKNIYRRAGAAEYQNIGVDLVLECRLPTVPGKDKIWEAFTASVPRWT